MVVTTVISTEIRRFFFMAILFVSYFLFLESEIQNLKSEIF